MVVAHTTTGQSLFIKASQTQTFTIYQRHIPQTTRSGATPYDATKSGKTDKDGNITFTDLDPGAWSVVSVLSVDGYEKVNDADSSVNWKAELTVVEGAVAETSFAPAAKASSSTLPAMGLSTALFASVAGLLMLAGISMKRRISL